MSDKQTPGQPVTTQVAAQAAKTTNDAWGQPISPERQAELQGYLDRWEAETNHGGRKGPFDYDKPNREEWARRQLTGADVYWLAKQIGSDEYDAVPNLHLEGSSLNEAHLEGADLMEAHLEGASLYT